MTHHYRLRLMPVRHPTPVYIHIADAARELGFDGDGPAFRAWFNPQNIPLDRVVFLDVRDMETLRARARHRKRGAA